MNQTQHNGIAVLQMNETQHNYCTSPFLSCHLSPVFIVAALVSLS